MRFYTVEIGREGMPRVMVTAEVAAHMSREGHEMVPWLYEDGITLEELRALDGGPEALARWMAGDDSALNAYTMRMSQHQRADQGTGTVPGQERIEWPAPEEAVNPVDGIAHLDFGVNDLDPIDGPTKSSTSEADEVERGSHPTAAEIEELWSH